MRKRAKMLFVLCLSLVVFSSGMFVALSAGATRDRPTAESGSLAGEAPAAGGTANSNLDEVGAADAEDPSLIGADSSEDAQPAADAPVVLAAGGIVATCPITTTADATPVLIFNSPIAGTIRYEGGWYSPTATALQGENMIEFAHLDNGYYENCSFVVEGESGQSLTFVHPPFGLIMMRRPFWTRRRPTGWLTTMT